MVLCSALLMTCSAVERIVWAFGEPAISLPTLWLQILLPIAASLLLALMLLTAGKDRLYLTAVPVWMGIAFFAVKSLKFPSLMHTAAYLLLYLLAGGVYTATVTGRLPTQKLLWPLFGLPLMYRLAVEDTQKIHLPVHEWLPELSLLCVLTALLCASLTVRRAPAGTRVRHFGDRNDGRRLRSLSPIFAVSPFIMKKRSGAQNLMTDHIETSAVDRYIEEKREEGLKNFGILHVWLAVYIRAIARYPGLNRFIAGQRIYSRGREVEVNMTVKREMTPSAPDTVIKVVFDPADTAQTVYEKFDAQVQTVKNARQDSSFDALAGALNYIPGPLLSCLISLLTMLDYFGGLPRALTRLSPFHGTMFVTSMASLGIPPVFHHLYEFGNVPVFVAIGRRRRAYETQRDGTVVCRKYIDCNYSMDERIVDGYYFASAMRYIHSLLHDPAQLDLPPETVNPDVD